MPYNTKKVGLTFAEFYNITEALDLIDKGKGGFKISTDNGRGYGIGDGITIIKKLYSHRKDIFKFLKLHPYELSPILIAISLMIMGINVQRVIDKNPELLNITGEMGPKIILKAASILDKHPNLKNFIINK